ncbi:hypothetical protein [Bacteroides sp. 519]|uniref:hypothetical protein n=1 Tax=Bacteroides sp. 519 TaxID=2302937 RepID=UPI0013D781B4|nr:hypothetical protein [Bacteroides sp. 519]NDV58061.1 hypothetical protein [Bacteroides sp. 519]
MKTESNKITAAKGKVLRRISDGFIFGNEIYLGYTHYLNNKPLPEPLLELPEHYEEIDEPVTEDTVILSKEMDIIEETPEGEVQRITIGDYKKLEDCQFLVSNFIVCCSFE